LILTNFFLPSWDNRQDNLLSYLCIVFDCANLSNTNRLVAVLCDGCGFGTKARDASERAGASFVEYLKSKQAAVTVQEAARCVVEATECAHTSIFQSTNEAEIWGAGNTSLCGTPAEMQSFTVT